MDSINRVSSSRSLKFRKPTKVSSGLKVPLSNKDKRNTLKVGTSINTVNKITAGATQSHKKPVRLAFFLMEKHLLNLCISLRKCIFLRAGAFLPRGKYPTEKIGWQ